MGRPGLAIILLWTLRSMSTADAHMLLARNIECLIFLRIQAFSAALSYTTVHNA